MLIDKLVKPLSELNVGWDCLEALKLGKYMEYFSVDQATYRENNDAEDMIE